ncbi:hypothetical protein GGS20DRAFT_547865, partial [Poronia punctata]
MVVFQAADDWDFWTITYCKLTALCNDDGFSLLFLWFLCVNCLASFATGHFSIPSLGSLSLAKHRPYLFAYCTLLSTFRHWSGHRYQVSGRQLCFTRV